MMTTLASCFQPRRTLANSVLEAPGTFGAAWKAGRAVSSMVRARSMAAAEPSGASTTIDITGNCWRSPSGTDAAGQTRARTPTPGRG